MVAVPLFEAVALEDGHGLRLRGELDLATADDLRQMLATLPNGASTVTLDLADLTFMDSSGLQVLWEHTRTLNDGSLVLENAPRHIRRLFEITGLDKHPAIELRGDR